MVGCRLDGDSLVIYPILGSPRRIPLSEIDPDSVGARWITPHSDEDSDAVVDIAGFLVPGVLPFRSRDPVVHLMLRDGERLKLSNVDRQFVHELISRSREAAAARPQPPTASPLEGRPPGWYQTPWNPSPQRYWTGHSWAGASHHRTR